MCTFGLSAVVKPCRLTTTLLPNQSVIQTIPTGRSTLLPWYGALWVTHRDDPAVSEAGATDTSLSTGYAPSFVLAHVTYAAQGSLCGIDLLRRIPRVTISSRFTVVSEVLYSLIQAASSTDGAPMANVVVMISWCEDVIKRRSHVAIHHEHRNLPLRGLFHHPSEHPHHFVSLLASCAPKL